MKLKTDEECKDGDLRLWWIPQVPMKAFHFDIPDLETGVLMLELLAKYDMFQFENNVKPDYSNAGGILVFEDGEFCDWMDPETGEDDPEEFLRLKAEEAIKEKTE